MVEWDADGAGPAQSVLVACGDLASYGVPSDVQWWNGRSWASLGTGVGSEGAVATSMVLLPDGGLVGGGHGEVVRRYRNLLHLATLQHEAKHHRRTAGRQYGGLAAFAKLAVTNRLPRHLLKA